MKEIEAGITGLLKNTNIIVRFKFIIEINDKEKSLEESYKYLEKKLEDLGVKSFFEIESIKERAMADKYLGEGKWQASKFNPKFYTKNNFYIS